MTKVHILPPQIVSKIAAGEVVERPASVAKELLENAIDAQTQTIKLSLKNAGKTSIHIKDTGTGIEPEDIEKIFHRHSTSKIQNLKDLFQIQSLGFRGEALYSIASVADITLCSKTKSNDTGWKIHMRGGEKLNLRPVSMAEGTEVTVNELFFNTPARKKFLKTDTAELQQILNIFIPYTLLYPKKAFSLTHNNKTIIELHPDTDYISRAEKALHLKTKDIIETKKDFPDKAISIHLILGDINIQRSRKDMQFIFVNNRPVQNYFIAFHLNQIYRLILPQGIHPFFAVYLNLSSEDIDVNIHPTKREVKIRNESTIISLLRNMCEHTLMSHGKPKEASGIVFSYEKPTESKTIREPLCKDYGDTQYPEKQITFPHEMVPLPRQEDDLKKKLSIAYYIGTFLNKYLFFESANALLIIDQHAAQERVSYEELIEEIQSGHIEIQRLLTPFIIQLSPQEILSWENLKDIMEKIGLQTTLWDNANLAIHAHPPMIKKPEIALRNILSGEDTESFDTDSVAKRACRNSVMAGDKMVSEEVEYLRSRLIKCKDPFICPHGRPTVIEIKEKIFEKEFMRK